jgi:chromate transporter
MMTDMPPKPNVEGENRLRELAALFLRLGFTAFGGPAAHIAMFHDEVVTRRQWITDEHFLDLLGATNLIPGPNSTEMAIHIGYVRAGWRGLIVAGLCFIIPAASIVLILAGLYVQFGSTPTANWLLYGIKPVIIAIIVQALWSLGRKAVKSVMLAAVGIGTFALYLAGFNEVALLFVGGLLVMLLQNIRRLRSIRAIHLPLLIALPGLSVAQAAVPVSLGLMFLNFLKIGAVLYGSGYVLLAFLRGDFVNRLGWLTDQQLLDAVAVGQFTPGPVSSTATFIGFLLGGLPGAVVATVGIFLPSFIFVALSNPIIPHVRRSPMLSGLLDGVNVTSLALMAAVTLQLGQAALIDWLTIILALAASVALLRYKVNATWLIGVAAVIGVIYHLLIR